MLSAPLAGFLSGCGPDLDAHWEQLRGELTGTLLRPTDIGYEYARIPRNLAYDDIRTAGIARCAHERDVEICVQWARANGITPTVRSPFAHSYAGFSTAPGLTIDISNLNRVEVDEGNGEATIGAGALLGDVAMQVYDSTNSNFLFPAGQCKTVGISGLLLAGGMGFNARRYGMTCDQLLETRIVTADGLTATVNANEHPDLFWALRGGGGGSFGVNLSYRVKIFEVTEQATYFRYLWRGLDNIKNVLGALQPVADMAPDTFSMIATVYKSNKQYSLCQTPGSSDKPELRIQGQFWAQESEFLDLIAPLVAVADPHAAERQYSTYIDGTEFLSVRGDPNAFYDKSRFYNDSLTPTEIGNAVDWIADVPEDVGIRSGVTAFFLYGGQIAQAPPEGTAFFNRSGRWLREGCVSWCPGNSEAEQRAKDWMNDGDFPDNQPVFANFARRDLEDWQTAYYGAHYERLTHVKYEYDPDDLFNFEQSIAPVPEPTGPSS